MITTIVTFLLGFALGKIKEEIVSAAVKKVLAAALIKSHYGRTLWASCVEAHRAYELLHSEGVLRPDYPHTLADSHALPACEFSWIDKKAARLIVSDKVWNDLFGTR